MALSENMNAILDGNLNLDNLNQLSNKKADNKDGSLSASLKSEELEDE